jgi:hypothetical protein
MAQQDGSLLLKWGASENRPGALFPRQGPELTTIIDVSSGEFRYALSDLPAGDLRSNISDSAEILTLVSDKPHFPFPKIPNPPRVDFAASSPTMPRIVHPHRA